MFLLLFPSELRLKLGNWYVRGATLHMDLAFLSVYRRAYLPSEGAGRCSRFGSATMNYLCKPVETPLLVACQIVLKEVLGAGHCAEAAS